MAEALSNSLFDLWNKLQGVLCSTASSSCPLVLPSLLELDEMVYEVYSPPLEEKPELEILFFHGLKLQSCTEAHITTWMSEDNSVMWPKTWLVEAFPKARIITVAYDSAAKKTNKVGRLDMFLTRENLLSALTSDSARVGDAQCPIVLVGHCLGGLLLKELCLQANKMLSEKREEIPGMQRIHDFFHNLQGMFFYGTPHLGSLLGDKMHDCFNGSLLAEIEILNAWSARKNASFFDLKARYNRLTYGMGEAQETFVDVLGKSIHVVPEASSRANMDMYRSVNANHYDLCKPKGKQGSAFSFLQEFLRQIYAEYILQSRDQADAVSRREYVVDKIGRATEVKRMLAKPNAHTIFIVGLSGIGKTTLAQQVFHDISHTFAIACFIYLDNFAASSNSNEEVLKKIEIELKRQGRGSNFDHFDVPLYLKGKQVLLILDNLQSESQLNALGCEIWLKGSNSRLLLTTTYSRLGSSSNTFEVKYLRRDESRQLFHHYAFAHRTTPQSLKYPIEQVIQRCGDFPLSLKILGSYLSAEDVNDQDIWRDLLVRLKNAEEVASGPDYRLWARLRPCYDALAPSEKELFLDVAVVFCDVPLELVKHLWCACRLSSAVGWRNLKRGFLVAEDESGRVWMHELLRNLGRSIACPQNHSIDKWRRISRGVSQRDFVAKYEGIMETLSLELQIQGNERLTMKNTTLVQYSQLEYLILDGVNMTQGRVELPSSLVYLKWKNARFETCPVDFNRLKNLAVLDLQYCKSMRILPASVVTAKKLKWVELEGCRSLIELPKGLYDLSEIEYLGLSMTGLTKISSKVGKLKKLRHFRADQTELARVPKSVGCLGMLQSLNISNTAVTFLPESISDLKFLTTLDADNTKLSSLPDSIGRLGNLQILNLGHTLMKSLPESLGNAVGLVKLFLNSTPLETLPDSMCLLRSLERLFLEDTRIRTLPDAFGELENLRQVSLQGSRVRSLPETFKKLHRLDIFQLTISSFLNDGKHSDSGPHSTLSSSHQDLGCLANFHFEFDRLESGGENPGVEEEGETLERIPGFLLLKIPFQRVSELRIVGEHTRQSLLPALFLTVNKLTSLRHLVLEFFNEVEALPSEIGALTGLTWLEVQCFEKLRELPESLGLLPIEHLDLTDLPRLRRLPECLGVAKRLVTLSVISCGSVQSMPTSFGHRFPSDRDSSTACGDECLDSADSSPSLDHELPPISLETDSWRLLRCSLECGTRRTDTIFFSLKCEDMKRVSKMAVVLGESFLRRGIDEKLKVNTMVLRKLCLQWQAGDGVHLPGIFRPSTVWLPLNAASRTRIVLHCEDSISICNIHKFEGVRVLDTEEEDATDTEEESDRDQVEVDSDYIDESTDKEDATDTEEESDRDQVEEDSDDIDESTDKEDQHSKKKAKTRLRQNRKLSDPRQSGPILIDWSNTGNP